MGSSLDLYFFRRRLQPSFHRDGVDLTHIIVPPEFRSHDLKATNAKAEGPQAPRWYPLCTFTAPPGGALHQFEMQTDSGEAFTLTENRAPLGQGSNVNCDFLLPTVTPVTLAHSRAVA